MSPFGGGSELGNHLHSHLNTAITEVDRMDPDALLAEDADVLVSRLLDEHMPVEVSFDWGNATRSPTKETTLHLPDRHTREMRQVRASQFVVSYPILGTVSLLTHRARTIDFSGEPQIGTVNGREFDVRVVAPILTSEIITDRLKDARADMIRRAEWANSELRDFLRLADTRLREVVAARRSRIENDRAVVADLNIPVRKLDAPRPPSVPAKRKHVSLKERSEQAGVVAEPVLEEAVYRDTLDAVRSWANTIERSPATTRKLDEEGLRDLLLGTLNSYWQGAAGGELFNGEGKTDILIRHEDRNAFIAELKIWRGQKTATDALTQLLGYLVWRDSKAALVMFIGAADPVAIIDKLHSAAEAHPKYVETVEGGDPARLVDYVFTADAEGRRVSLAILPVVITKPSTSA
ncbi:hypothetical protein [Williamsia sp.]|uniref:hypothetical protein n=1 Tax=Williamsia sp. TaxID=1872085 RepID=UPI001A2C3C9F|nr:hypothetical protein [Williamsia sp.]MBJ7287575.1 hypothetical protein [Williamsia sp.]